MSILLKVNGRDLSSYIRPQHGEGLDPADPDYSEPQFSGAPAFTEGQEPSGEAVGNREWTIPLLLDGTDRAALHQLIEDINGDLFEGAQVQFAVDGSIDPISYFDLQAGRLEPEFQYYLSIQGVTRATLRLWTRPYAYTGTARTVASLGPGNSSPLATMPIVQFPATGIDGDRIALANLEVQVGSHAATTARIIAYGIHRSASFAALHTPSDGRLEAQASSVATGASGAVASRYYAIPISPTAASGVSARDYLVPPEAYVGRHRVFGFVRSNLTAPVTLYAKDRFGAVLGPTVIASQTGQTEFQMVDLGEIQVPARASGQGPVPTQYVEVFAGGSTGASPVASPGFALSALCYLPLDISPGMFVEHGTRTAGILAVDDFARFGVATGLSLDSLPYAPVGSARWVHDPLDSGPGGLLANFGEALHIHTASDITGAATARYTLGSGMGKANPEITLDFRCQSSAAAASTTVQVYITDSRLDSGNNFRAKLALGPSAVTSLSLISKPSGAATVLHASAALGASAATAMYSGQLTTLRMKQTGDLVDVWLGTAAFNPTPILSATHANLTVIGHPALAIGDVRTVTTPASRVVIEQIRWVASPGGASAPAANDPRESFRFDSHPDQRTYRGNASIFTADILDGFRGDYPQIPNVASGQPSGPPQVVVLAGDIGQFVGNDILEVKLRVGERWRYLR